MGRIKVFAVLLIYLVTSPGYHAAPETVSVQSRKDSYDEILRPPPPPPPHLSPMRVHHHSHGQPRFQRHPRQPFHPGPPPFHQERYPHPPESSIDDQSFFQRISGWLFSGNKDNSQQLSPNGPSPNYGPPHPVYGVPFINSRPQKPVQSSGVQINYGQPAGGPSLSYGVPHDTVPPPLNIISQNIQPQVIKPHETYGVPPTDYSAKPSNIFSQQRSTPKKNCNPCNMYPWIPVLTYQTQKQQINSVGDQFNFNPNSLSSSNGKHNEPFRNELSTQLTVPLDSKPYSSFVSPISNISPSPPSIFPGEPFSLSHLELENNGALFTKPLTNSYGTPIPSDTYGSPYPATDDGSPLTIDINRDNLQHVGSNNVPQISKPTTSTGYNGEKYANRSAPLNQNTQDKNRKPGLVIGYDKGRNIHTLQPIPLPNLSPVPIPPLFNARPFTTNKSQYNNVQTYSPQPSSGKLNPSIKSNIQVINSVPVAEFTSSVEYPISIVQSPILDIDTTKINQHQNSNFGTQRINTEKPNPITVKNENVKQNYDSYSAATGGNDHEFGNSEQEEVVYSTTQSYTTESQFLPTPLVHLDDKIKNDVYFNPSTITPFESFTALKEENKGSYSHPSTTIVPHFQDYEEYPTNLLFQPADPDQLQAIDSPLLYLSPNLPHKESKPFKAANHRPSTHGYENNVFVSSSPLSTTAPPVTDNVTSSWKNAFRFIDNRAVPGKWPPPSPEENGDSSKKSKRIQIIIPYTSQNQPAPFQFSASDVISSSGWIPMTEELGANYGRKVPESNQESVNGLYTSNSLADYHESSESKVVASSTSSVNSSSVTPKPYYDTTLNTILSYTTTPRQESNKISFDMMKLQQNIDDWTVQEFSKIYKKQQKASTTSHLKRSKKIPDDYFTTLPPTLKTTRALLTTINDLGSFIDNEAAGSIQHSVETDLSQPKTVSNIENEILEEDPVTITSKPTYYISTTPYPTTSYYRETTTQPPKTTTRHSWERIFTSISPLTKERVYVVTPLPIELESPRELNNKIVAIQGNRKANVSESIRTIKKEDLNSLTFKSPRFLVRPTPGPTGSQRDRNILIAKSKNSDAIPISGIDWLHSINNLIDTTTTQSPSKSFFGLAAVTAYTPPVGSTVLTYAGHSKVITVTPATEVK